MLEGLDETLTLHRLGLADRLGQSLLTTNGLESILVLVEQRVGKVDRWTTSDQKERWLATTLVEIEPPAAPTARLSNTTTTASLPEAGLTEGKEVRVA